MLAQALEIDPNYVPAWTELGYVYERQTTTLALQPKDEGIELARDAIQKALLINPQYGPAYAVLARIEMFYGWDFKAASQYIQQALASNPGDAFILLSAARVSGSLGRLDEAISLHQQSIAVDPVSAVGHYRLGRTLYRAHRLDEALDSFRMALSLNPVLFSAHLGIGLVLVAQGDAPAALAEIAAMAAIEQEEPITSLVIACAQHALGNAGASDNALQALIEAEFDYHVAKVHAFRGDINLAFDWLNQAYDNRDAGLASLLIDPELASLHDDPRWESLLDKMGLLH